MFALVVSLLLAQGSPTMAGPAHAAVHSSAAAGPDNFFQLIPSTVVLASQCTGSAITSVQADAISVSRASTRFCTKSDFTGVTLTSNQPALEGAGLSVEGSRTNLALRSMELGNAAWTASQVTVTSSNTGTFADGNVTMELITSTNPVNSLSQEATVSSSVGPFTASVYAAKTVGTGPAGVGVTCASGVATCTCYREDGTACTVDVTINTLCFGKSTFGTTARRLSVTATCSEAESSVFISLNPNDRFSGVNGAAYLGGAQLEEAAFFPSSYIATAGVAVNRPAETVATTLTTNIATAGCIAATITIGPWPDGDDPAARAVWGTTSTSDIGYVLTRIAIGFSLGDGSDEIATSGEALANATTTVRAYWSGSTMGIASAASSSTGTFVPSMTTNNVLTIGDAPASGLHLFGNIRNLRAGSTITGCAL